MTFVKNTLATAQRHKLSFFPFFIRPLRINYSDRAIQTIQDLRIPLAGNRNHLIRERHCCQLNFPKCSAKELLCPRVKRSSQPEPCQKLSQGLEVVSIVITFNSLFGLFKTNLRRLYLPFLKRGEGSGTLVNGNLQNRQYGLCDDDNDYVSVLQHIWD